MNSTRKGRCVPGGAHVDRPRDVVAVDLLLLEAHGEERDGGLEPDGGEGVVFDDVFFAYAEDLLCPVLVL